MDLYSYYELTPAQRDAVLGQGYVPDKPAPKPEKVTKYDAKTNAILNMPPEKTNAYVKALQNSLRGQQAAQNEIISGIKKGQEVPQGFIGNILDVGTGELRGLAEAAKIPVTVSKAGMELYNQYLPEDLKSLMHTQERINDANKALQDIESFKNKNLPYTHEASLEHFMQAPSLNEGVALTTHLVGENLPALVAGGYAGKIAGGLAAGAGAAEKGVEAATRIGNVAAFTPFEAAPTYNQMREQGVDPTKAAIASIGYAVPSSMVESYLGEVPLANKIIGESGAKDIGKTLSQKIAKTVTGIIKTGLGEGSENGIQQVMRNIADNAVGIQTDIFKDVPSSVVGGTLGGLGIGVPGNIMLQAKSASVQDRTATKENLNKQNKILNESINHIENDQEATPEEKTKAKENIVKIVNDNQNKIDAINQVESNEAVASQPVESQPESLGNYYDKKQELQGYINNTNSIISNYENDPTLTEEEKAVARETHNQIIDNTQLQIDEINEHLLKNEKPEIIQSEEFKKNHPDVYSLYEESLVPESVTTVEQPIIEELPKPNLEGTVTENIQPEAIVEEPMIQNNQTVKEPTYEELSNNDNYTELKTNYKNIDAANKIATSLRNKSSNNDYIIVSKDDKFAIFKTPKQVETQHVEEKKPSKTEELKQKTKEKVYFNVLTELINNASRASASDHNRLKTNPKDLPKSHKALIKYDKLTKKYMPKIFKDASKFSLTNIQELIDTITFDIDYTKNIDANFLTEIGLNKKDNPDGTTILNALYKKIESTKNGIKIKEDTKVLELETDEEYLKEAMGDYNKSIIAANNIEEATKIYGDAIAYLGDPDLNISDKDRRPYIDYIDKVYTEKYNSLKAKKKEVKSNDKENIPGISSNQRERESTKQTKLNKTTSRKETSASGVLQAQNEEVKQTNLLPEGEKQTEENQKKTDIEIKKKDQESKIEEVKQNKLLDTEMYSEKNASGMQGNIFRDIEEEKPKSKTPNADKLKEKVKGEIFYKILGLPKNATLEQIKKAFREKSLELHPDQNKADNAEQSFKDLYKEYDQALKVIQENSINAQRKAKAEAEREKANKAWEAYEKGVEKRRAETKTSDNPVIDGWKIGLKSFYQKNKDGKWIKIGGNSYGYVYHKPTIEKLEKALNEINNKKNPPKPEGVNKEIPIPTDLKNSKPRYKLHELKFSNFVDLALYTVRNRTTESKRHNDFMNYLKKVFPNKTESEIRSLGDSVLNRIKVLESASMNDKEVLTIEEETPPKGRSEKGQSLNPIEALANVVDAVVNPAINLAKTSYNNLNTWVLAKGKKMPYGGIQDKNMRWVDFKRDIALIDHFIDPESAVWKYSKIASKAMSILKQANIVISNNTYRTQQELEKIKIDAKKNNIDDVTIIDVMENKTTSTNPIVNDLASRLKTMLKSMKTKVINELVDSKRISPDIKYTLSNADYESLSATLFNKGIMNSKKSNYSTNYLKSHPEIILTNIPNNSLAQKLAAGKYTLNYDNYNITMQGDSTTKLIENFKQELESKWGIEDYFPHMWRGQFAVRNVTDIDPENHFIENFCESPKDFQERVLPALQAKYGNSIKQMEFEIAPKQISMDTNSTNLNRKLWMMLVDKTAKLGNIERSEMASMMKALNIKIQYDIKGKSDMNLTSQREKDLDTYIKTLDTLNVYFAQAERFVELNKAIREVTPMIEKIDKDQPQLKQFVKNYINALKGTWTDLDRIVNNQLTRIGMSKRDITNIENALLTYNYHALLGGFIFNLSSPLANLTQNVNTYALTGEKAFGQALKNITTNEGKAIIQDLYDRNILTIEDFKFNAETFTHSVENPTLKFLGQLNTTLFQLAEKVNRSMAALAFHYDGIEKGLTGKSLDEHIRIGVQSTQFDNTVSGQPLISRMGVPRLITQFKGFLCKTLNLSFGLYNDTLKAYQSGNKTLAKEKLKESIRFTLGYLAVGGPMAIAPMAVLNTSLGILGSLLNILGVNPEDTVDDVGWTALMQNWFTEAASKGLLGFLGIDISPSVQIMIPSTPKDFLGPTLGPIITSALQGNKNLKDAIADVSENFTPNNVLALARLGNIRALNNIIDAYFAQTTGSFLSKKMKQEYDVITFLQKVASPKTLMHIKETQPYVYKKIMDGTINDVNTYKVITTAFGLRPLSRNSNIQTWLDIKKYDDTVKTKGLARKQHIIELRTQALKAKEEGNIKEYDKKLEESKKLKDQTIKEGYYTKTGLTTSVKTEAKKNLNPIKAEEKQIKSIFKKENKAKRAMSK